MVPAQESDILSLKSIFSLKRHSHAFIIQSWKMWQIHVVPGSEEKCIWIIHIFDLNSKLVEEIQHEVSKLSGFIHSFKFLHKGHGLVVMEGINLHEFILPFFQLR